MAWCSLGVLLLEGLVVEMSMTIKEDMAMMMVGKTTMLFLSFVDNASDVPTLVSKAEIPVTVLLWLKAVLKTLTRGRGLHCSYFDKRALFLLCHDLVALLIVKILQ